MKQFSIIRNRLPLKTGFFILVPLVFFIAGCSRDDTSPPVELPETVKDCTYNLETTAKIRIKATNPAHPLNGKDYVLLKRHAFIPAWKVWSGFGGGEMEELGVTEPHPDTPGNPDGFGKRVFVGLGHCKDAPDPYNCSDPLPQTMVFVVQKEGAEPPEPIPGAGEEEKEGFWWDFNGYFAQDKLPSNPTNEDLPCWVKECVDGDARTGPCPMPEEMGVASADVAPPNFVIGSNIQVRSPTPPNWNKIKDKNYLLDKEITGDPAKDPENWAEEVGTYEAGAVFEIFYDTVEGYLILDESGGADDGNYFRYQEVEATSGKNPTLQLDMFIPLRKFRYEWWVPSCKPVVYLYPEKPKKVSVLLKPFGVITESIPSYPLFVGWKDISAYPDGSLTYKGEEYDSLYYEGRIINLKVPKEGFVLKQPELKNFFTEILPKLGLNEKESSDFMEYWLSRLNKKDKYYFAALIPREEIERTEPMELSEKVDTSIRVRFYFKELAEPIEVSTPGLNLVPPERNGFTVVDWGGFYRD